jgi:hypothetical protein
MQSRLHHLESLVIGMMNEQPSRNGSSRSGSVLFNSSETSIVQEVQSLNGQESSNHSRASQADLFGAQSASGIETASGRVVLGLKETAYVGATHWAAILEDVNQFRLLFLWYLFPLIGLTQTLIID